MNIYLDSKIQEAEKEEILKDLEKLEVGGISSIKISRADQNGAAIQKGSDYVIEIIGNKKDVNNFNLPNSKELFISTYQGELQSIAFKYNKVYLISLK